MQIREQFIYAKQVQFMRTSTSTQAHTNHTGYIAVHLTYVYVSNNIMTIDGIIMHWHMQDRQRMGHHQKVSCWMPITLRPEG